VYAFGDGMTYSSFSYNTVGAESDYKISDLIVGARIDDGTTDVSWTVNVTNTGRVTSDVVVLAYVYSNNSVGGITPPIKELFDFQRVHMLAPGNTVKLILGVDYRVLSTIDQDGHSWLIPGEYELALNNEKDLTHRLTLHGEPMLIEDWPGAKNPPKTPIVTQYHREEQPMKKQHRHARSNGHHQ